MSENEYAVVTGKGVQHRPLTEGEKDFALEGAYGAISALARDFTKIRSAVAAAEAGHLSLDDLLARLREVLP